MDNNLTALINYQCEQVRPCICLANFLRLCGFIVDKNNVELNIGKSVIQQGDYYLVFDMCDEPQGKENSEDSTVHIFLGGIIKKINANDALVGNQKCTSMIEQMLIELKNEEVISDNIYRCLCVILRIYDGYDLKKIEYNCSRFSYDEELMSTAYDMYYYAEKKFEKLNEDIEQKQLYAAIPFVYYARAYSLMRMNEIENILNKYKAYDDKRFLSLARKAKELDSRFCAADYLIGQFYANEKRWNPALENYMIFLHSFGKKAYSSMVWYRYGKVMEEIHGICQAEPYYQRAIDLNRKNYQARYKQAVYVEFGEKIYLKAYKYYNSLIREFLFLLEKGILQPREFEYLFKLFFRCGRMLNLRMEEPDKAKTYFELAEKMGNIDFEKMKFFQLFYGGVTAENCFRKMIDRLPIFQVRINKQETEFKTNIQRRNVQ